LPPFAQLPHVERVGVTPEDAAAAVALVFEELQRRIRAGAQSWPRLLLAIDELAQLDPRSLELLGRVLSLGREMNVNVVAATQHPTAKLIGNKANYPVRLVGQVVDADTAEIAAGRRRSGAWLLPGEGAFLYVDGARLDRLQAYNVTSAAAPGLVAMIGERWGGSTPVQLPVVEPLQVGVEPVEDEITRIAGLIERLWVQGASKSAMCREALSKPYAGSYATKIDRAIALLERRSTTTTQLAVAQGAGRTLADDASSSRTAAAPILRMGAR
jgi:hypothetical protein